MKRLLSFLLLFAVVQTVMAQEDSVTVKVPLAEEPSFWQVLNKIDSTRNSWIKIAPEIGSSATFGENGTLTPYAGIGARVIKFSKWFETSFFKGWGINMKDKTPTTFTRLEAEGRWTRPVELSTWVRYTSEPFVNYYRGYPYPGKSSVIEFSPVGIGYNNVNFHAAVRPYAYLNTKKYDYGSLEGQLGAGVVARVEYTINPRGRVNATMFGEADYRTNTTYQWSGRGFGDFKTHTTAWGGLRIGF